MVIRINLRVQIRGEKLFQTFRLVVRKNHNLKAFNYIKIEFSVDEQSIPREIELLHMLQLPEISPMIFEKSTNIYIALCRTKILPMSRDPFYHLEELIWS